LILINRTWPITLFLTQSIFLPRELVVSPSQDIRNDRNFFDTEYLFIRFTMNTSPIQSEPPDHYQPLIGLSTYGHLTLISNRRLLSNSFGVFIPYLNRELKKIEHLTRSKITLKSYIKSKVLTFPIKVRIRVGTFVIVTANPGLPLFGVRVVPRNLPRKFSETRCSLSHFSRVSLKAPNP